jgi:hypothetical protein
VLGNLCCGCNILMHNKFSCGYTVLENNLKLETIRGPSALSVYMSNLCRGLKTLIIYRLAKSQDGIHYYCIQFFNALPDSHKNLPPNQFLKQIKTHLLYKIIYSFDEFLTIHIMI